MTTIKSCAGLLDKDARMSLFIHPNNYIKEQKPNSDLSINKPKRKDRNDLARQSREQKMATYMGQGWK